MRPTGRRIEIHGTVQGVGFRPFVYRLALQNQLTGRVWNDSQGVTIEAFGQPEAIQRFTDDLWNEAPPAARVVTADSVPIPWIPARSFTIDESLSSPERRVSIPADLSICDDCLREIFDPNNRRYRYAFTNCTNCGPRYSIVTGAPYDRPMTSMACFTMCETCRVEYESPLDRRFHAQPNACPECGPRLQAVGPEGRAINTSDPLAFASRALRAGMTVAVKGLGGFHLACDATSPIAVERLRLRKRRETKPLAVMVADVAEAERVAELTEEERELLTSIERPIVLVRGRGVLAKEVSGQNPLVGLVLPYTPLHHLLMRDAGRPLVMTSGNVSDEPMVTGNREALAELRDIADIFLWHDRDIVTRVDDSIARVIDNTPTILRRARGYVPRAFESARPFSQPILACGAHLKNTFCIAAGSSAFLGPHIGDLESFETMQAYETAIERMKEFIGAAPVIVAHDLHPGYFSTRYAERQPGVRTIGVQHHHAHVVSAMAEHRLDGPVIGVAYDGTGFGTDGTSWGGEVLIARYDGFDRFATFRPLALAGGDQAVRQPWRVALALLDDVFGGEIALDEFPLFREIPTQAIEAVRRMIETKFNTSPARGVGRYFDAFGALFLALPDSHYEGEIAFRWNMIADARERGRYPIIIRDGAAPWELDPRPIVRAAVEDFLAGRPAGTISARFHNTLARATVEMARSAMALHGDLPVVLSGGCFQNARLAESVIDGLRGTAPVFMNHTVPPGDGGIALGQAFIADALLRAGEIDVVEEEEVAVCA